MIQKLKLERFQVGIHTSENILTCCDISESFTTETCTQLFFQSKTQVKTKNWNLAMSTLGIFTHASTAALGSLKNIQYCDT